jgi:GrpB-like predicted nucleotidyltransferase (UPF0157 family)
MTLLEPSEYQPIAARVAAEVGGEVMQLIPGCRVEHVGATSIPGAISKGDLEICVVVATANHLSTVNALEASGYVVKADTLRTPELCMLMSPRTDLEVALQVIAEGSQFEFFMRFRDALRADLHLVEQYNQLKTNFAPMGSQCYRDEKSKFIEAVLRSSNPSVKGAEYGRPQASHYIE